MESRRDHFLEETDEGWLNHDVIGHFSWVLIVGRIVLL
jgi:hypothetical protein